MRRKKPQEMVLEDQKVGEGPVGLLVDIGWGKNIESASSADLGAAASRGKEPHKVM